MIKRFITIAMLFGLAMPAGAQTLSDGDARLAGESILNAHNKASQAHDAAAMAALYTENAVIYTDEGPVSGRAAIQKLYADGFKNFTAEPATLAMVSAIGSGVLLRAGTWSGTYQGEKGRVHLKGYWTTTDVRDGDEWKIRMETWNEAAAQ